MNSFVFVIQNYCDQRRKPKRTKNNDETENENRCFIENIVNTKILQK